MLKIHNFFHNCTLGVGLIFASTSFLSGCAATGQNFPGFRTPSGESALIVVYRPDLFRAGGQAVKIAVDEQEVGVLRNAGWISIPVSPGERAIKLEERFTLFPESAALKVTAEKGETIALRVLPGGITSIVPLAAGPIVAFGPWTIQQIPEGTAQSELRELKESK
jgi:hypothetical protein